MYCWVAEHSRGFQKVSAVSKVMIFMFSTKYEVHLKFCHQHDNSRLPNGPSLPFVCDETNQREEVLREAVRQGIYKDNKVNKLPIVVSKFDMILQQMGDSLIFCYHTK